MDNGQPSLERFQDLFEMSVRPAGRCVANCNRIAGS